MKQYFVYIMANKKNGTLYTGVTSDLIKRIYQHKNNLVSSFTSKYSISLLVYYELFSEIKEAIVREKQLKKWNRQWKINLIESMNPTWSDLYQQLF